MAIKVSSTREEYQYLKAHPHQCNSSRPGEWETIRQGITFDFVDQLTCKCKACETIQVFEFDVSSTFDSTIVNLMKKVGKEMGSTATSDVDVKYVKKDENAQRKKEAQELYNKGNKYANANNLRGAIKCFEQSLSLIPESHSAWYNKGICLGRSGDTEAAIECFDKAIELAPEDAEYWYNKGYGLYLLKRYEKSIECYEKALQFEPELGKAWLNKGCSLAELGRHKEAIECYDKALEIDPSDKNTLLAKKESLAML